MNRRLELALLFGITLVGAALRIYQIGAQSLWFDELLSVTISQLPITIVLTSPASIDPPLYYVLLHIWMGLGNGDGLIRLLSALAAIATIPPVYYLAKRLAGIAGGAFAASIFALAPLQLYFAQEARMYSLFVLFGTLSMISYLVAQERQRLRDWMVWTGLVAMMIYTHLFGGLLLLAMDADALVRWPRRRDSLRSLFLSNLLAGLLLLPLVVLILGKMSWLVPALWGNPPTIFQPLVTLDLFTFGETLPSWANVIALCIITAICAFTAVAVGRRLKQGGDVERDQLQFLLWVLLLPIAATWLVSQWRPLYLERLLLPSSIPLYLLLAWGIVRSDRKTVLRICAVVSLPLLLFAVYTYYADPDLAKPPLRQALSYVASARQTGEVVIHTSDSSFLAGRFYDPLGDNILLYNPADQWLTPALLDSLQVPYETNASRLVSGEKSYWLVVALDHIPDVQLAEKKEFDDQGIVLQTMQVGGIEIYHYGAKPGIP